MDLKSKIILISGPTASGKSSFAIKLAKKIKGEIINADSMQVYKQLKVLSARPDPKNYQSIKHHLYGFQDAKKSFSTGDWLKIANKKIIEVKKRKKIPILVGGTGLYFKALTDGLVEIKTGTGSVAKVKFYCESSNAHAQTLQAAPHSAASSAVLTLPTATGTLIGTGDSGTLPVAAIDIDGATDIGADLTTSDLIVVDDGAGGTNRKAAFSRVVTLMTNQGFTTDDPTALAIALG